MDIIYLDYNATTPIDPAVKTAMLPFLDDKFGNPSSSHWFGVQTKMAIEQARDHVAELLGCDADEIYFTSGGSESNNLAIKGYALAHAERGRHIITSAVEHPAVLQVCGFLEKNGFAITVLGVDEFGRIRLDELEKAIRPDTILITIMHANNEVGTIQPINQIGEIARKHGIAVHTDAAQSVGKIPVRVDDLGVDMLSIAGHKLYAPKGIGALYLRRGFKIEKQIHGADHERNLRAGTENVLEIVGLGEACRLITKNLPAQATHLKSQADRLLDGLQQNLDNVRLNGHPGERLPNTVSLSFYGLEANTILAELDSIAASAGAACHSGQVNMSHVLAAMNVPAEWAMGTIRFSVGRETTAAEIDVAIEQVSKTVRNLRGQYDGGRVSATKVIQLTHFTHGLGCACKLRPQTLESVLKSMPKPTDANILVGTESSDDAAVYRLDGQTAIVQTVDFFTPIVDDPFQFGAIAAANSLSDIYAMGARPLFALNIVGFPSNRLPVSVLDEILRGALAKAAEAGISIIGGHTVDDTEPKFGLAVTGLVHPEKIWRNIGALPGDKLVLTKPIGTGIIATAIKRGMAKPGTASEAIRVMSLLNKNAADAAQDFTIHACTDITGFGLLGHLGEMTRGSRVDAILYAHDVPVIPGALELAAAGAIPGGSKDNLDYVSEFVSFTGLSPHVQILLADAQTSGGLLFAVPAAEAEGFVAALKKKCETAIDIIGEITGAGRGLVNVTAQREKDLDS